MQSFCLLVVTPGACEYSQDVETFGDGGVVRPEYLFADGQGLLMEELGLWIETMNRLKSASLEEEAGGFGGVEVVAFDEGGALLDVGDVGLVVGIGSPGVGVGEGGVDGENSALGPDALSLGVHAVFEDGLDEAVDADGVVTGAALDEGVSE